MRLALRNVLGTAMLLCAATLVAQSTTGTLVGTVTSDGNPLPGVTVTVTSPALQGSRTEGLPALRVVLGEAGPAARVRQQPSQRDQGEHRVGLEDLASRGSRAKRIRGAPELPQERQTGALPPNISTREVLAGCMPPYRRLTAEATMFSTGR